jgi:C4-dicarboxylate-binding protein DctP
MVARRRAERRRGVDGSPRPTDDPDPNNKQSTWDWEDLVMKVGSVATALAAVALACLGSSASAQETIRLRIASGHPAANTYVNLMQNFFVPEVTKRVAQRTKHKVEFVEGYGGAMVKVADTLEGVQSGIIDIGGYCFCFEPSNLPLHAFQIMVPFGTMSSVKSLQVARAVYDKVPYMSKVFEDKYKQKLIALISDNGYNLGTNFEWNKVADLKGQKIAGAGLNLKWLEFAGATPVQSSLVDAYTSMQTGVYNGWIMFPSGWVNFKLYEVGKYYTEIGFGAITWHGLTINQARWNKLPKEVQDIIAEVAKEYEAKTGTVNDENYPKQIDELKKNGVNVRKLPDEVTMEWAKSLQNWPKEKAQELDKMGLPGTQVLETALAAAEQAGHKWPIRYGLK